ncbi:MAG: hypothetical protein QF613_07365 [Candidatus Marinimicrobia bacterium]|nr:hypothetical protein [Candidatus Neomarinimicrobiota bacterium]MDP6594003.1 hypothetical protein [Candidatus Neomarinimicrobiota bacterium]MDP6836838.1 hypothetical protein [Candidatus Neomarinimicrobiota bacterium]
MEKSSISSRTHKIWIALISFHLLSGLSAQEGEIVPLSVKVGMLLDAEENAILGIFPDVKGFESAQFYQLSENRYEVKISYIEQTVSKSTERMINWKQFQRLRYRAGSHPEITDEMREAKRDFLMYLQVHNIMDDIPPSTYCKLKHSNGTALTGTFIEYKDKMISFQSTTRRIDFPIEELESITYRPYIDDGNMTKKVIAFALGALVGVGMEEMWNVQSRPSIDLVWHNRFTGLILGLVAGPELVEAVTVLTSPDRFIKFTPEEVAKMK